MTPTEFKAALMPNVTATVQNGTAADILGMVEAMHAAIVGTLIAIKADALSAQLLEASSRYMDDIEMVKRHEAAQKAMRDANKALKHKPVADPHTSLEGQHGHDHEPREAVHGYPPDLRRHPHHRASGRHQQQPLVASLVTTLPMLQTLLSPMQGQRRGVNIL